MQLHYQFYLGGETRAAIEVSLINNTPLLIVPGLFGSTTNWRAIAKQLSKSQPVIVIDQRNHGESPHADSNTYLDMANDLGDFLDQHNLATINLCGHSMGGKTSMLFSLLQPQKVNKLIVLDIAPVSYQHSHLEIIAAMQSVDLATLESRQQADQQLKKSVQDTGMRLFLLQNLVSQSGTYQWRINLPVLSNYMDDIVDFPIVQDASYVDALFVNGANSDYVLTEHHSKILEYFPSAEFVTIENAGHWLHAEQPKQLIETLNDFL